MKIIECPRDAMQGIKEFISSEIKIEYINQLLQCGFDTIDFGSFVSAKAIPQLRDTAEVLSKLKLDNTSSKLLAIVANKRGADDACNFDEIKYLGYPFSISETFQQRNTNTSIEGSLIRVDEIQNLAAQNSKELVIYISMAFGNPYGDAWDSDLTMKWIEKLSEMGINTFALADTIAVAEPNTIKKLFTDLYNGFSHLEFGAHFHTTPVNWRDNVSAALDAGCQRFDTAIKGFGGCPMAKDELTGNLATENLISILEEKEILHHIDKNQFDKAMKLSIKVFN